MINNVTLVGRLTRDSELQQSNAGTLFVRFSIAVRRDRKNNNGEYDTDFINCVAFGKTAEIIGQYGFKGMLIGVIGRIQVSTYQDDNGATRNNTDIIVNNFTMLESSNQNRNNANQQQPPQQQQQFQQQPQQQYQQGNYNQQQQFQQQPQQQYQQGNYNQQQQFQQQQQGFSQYDVYRDISNDDLPF